MGRACLLKPNLGLLHRALHRALRPRCQDPEQAKVLPEHWQAHAHNLPGSQGKALSGSWMLTYLVLWTISEPSIVFCFNNSACYNYLFTRLLSWLGNSSSHRYWFCFIVLRRVSGWEYTLNASSKPRLLPDFLCYQSCYV